MICCRHHGPPSHGCFFRAAHHVTQRGNYRQDVFFAAGDRRQYLAWLTEYAKKYGLEVWACGLMTNHIHLIAVPHHQGPVGRESAAPPALTLRPLRLCEKNFLFLAKAQRTQRKKHARERHCPGDSGRGL
ncbi:MAG: hypothetical protein FJ128_13780 [Deltaproteobacteria bacterium]|nr:hypothetical protein [Deltaproteobacteria bacterium]